MGSYHLRFVRYDTLFVSPFRTHLFHALPQWGNADLQAKLAREIFAVHTGKRRWKISSFGWYENA